MTIEMVKVRMSKLVKYSRFELYSTMTSLVLTITISAVENMLETILVQVLKKARILSMVEVFGANNDFKVLGHVNFKRSPMRHPGNASFVLWSGENVLDLLSKSHIPDVINGVFITLLWRSVSEISIRMVDCADDWLIVPRGTSTVWIVTGEMRKTVSNASSRSGIFFQLVPY